jgi:hypothetical protein
VSAYIVNPEHLGILAAYAAFHRVVISAWSHDQTVQAAQQVAIGLAKENIRSVAHRYPDTRDGERPGPNLRAAEIEEAAAIYAGHFITHPQRITPTQILKLLECLEYQSCETRDWPQTLAYQQLGWIRAAAIRSLPGYDQAQWTFNQPIPEIDALYQRGAA